MEETDAAPAAGRDLVAFEAALGHHFRDRRLLEAALTHRSYSNERGEGENYERLEFLGDAVLGLVTGHWLYDRYAARPEGDLAKIKSFLVSARVLSRHGAMIGVGELLRFGVGEARSGGHKKASIVADALEAAIGAVYLDAGLDAARAVVVPILEQAEAYRRAYTDAKTRLQEVAQARGWKLPSYRIVAEAGPDHQKRFTVDCWVDGARLGTAEGNSKKRAEQAAATAALAALEAREAAASAG